MKTEELDVHMGDISDFPMLDFSHGISFLLLIIKISPLTQN